MAKKILVIDDSALMRRVISDIINEGNEYEVAAIAKDGLEGFDLIVSNPNLYSAIILDINMPKMNGLELLQKLQKNHIEQTVIVVSTVAKEGAKETIQALEYGAFDFVTKPENYFETKGNDFKKRIHDMLNVATSSKASVERTRSATGVKPSGYSGSRLTSGRTSSLIPSEKKASIDAISALRRRNEINDTIPPKVNPSRFTNIKSGSKKVVALACSTGGPKSLQQVIPMLPKNLDAGVVLVQHMPAGFTASLAARLNEISDINVKEGADGDVIQKGWVYIAPGGKHIEVVKKASEYVIKLNDEPPIDGLRPCANVNDYISYINSKAAEWGNRGAQTYFVSVGPVQNDPYCSNAEIESFNAAMQANLSGVTYIDVYSHLVSEGFSTVDGTHYPDSVSVDIYNYILDHLEEQRSGIWG